MSKLLVDLSSVDFTDNRIHKKYDPSFITRYVIVANIVEEIRKQIGETKPLHILDLGGYNGAARALLPNDHVTILDVFDDSQLEDYLQVNSVGIPKADDSFDIVISTDVMEHIQTVDRDKFVEDAIRTAKYATIIAAPFEHSDKSVGFEEDLANGVYKGQTGTDYNWLKEHREYTLPSTEWLDSKLALNEGLSYAKFSHTSLRLWGELTTIGYFIANNIEPVEPKLAKRLKQLDNQYFKKIAVNDFPSMGYRTVYVISKHFKSITVRTPAFNQDLIKDFCTTCRRALGAVLAEMSRLDGANNDNIKALRDRGDNLESERNEYRDKWQKIEPLVNSFPGRALRTLRRRLKWLQKRYS